MSEENEAQRELKRDTTNSDPDPLPITYAGFWMRLWAYLFDLFVVISINGIILAPLFVRFQFSEWSWGVFTIAGMLTAFISFGYFTWMTKTFQQTLGKQVFGLKVYSIDNRDISWTDIIFREIIGRYIHQSLVITNALYLIVAFSEQKRGIHDRIGHTYVGLEPRKGRTIKQANILPNSQPDS